jgi:hypothetical protein
MGCFDVFCVICGGPYYIPFNEESIFTKKKYKKITNWLTKAVILTASGETIKGAKEINCNNQFSKNNITYTVNTDYDFQDQNFGYFLHSDCYKYFYQKTGKKLRYDMLLNNIGGVRDRQARYNYGIIENYWWQEFKFIKAINDKKEFLFTSPLHDKKNSVRINKIISQFKLKPSRKGPEISASLAFEGDIRIGNNKMFWIKKNGKWMQMPIKPVVYKTKKYHEIKKISQICESSLVPLFCKLVPEKYIIFIGEESLIKKVYKYT